MKILAKTGNYKVSWITGFGGQIVKVRGELEGVQTGLGDIGVVPGSVSSVETFAIPDRLRHTVYLR